ncbi:hypothetical protein AB8O55_11655 [Saccharopolyspora cebuensis]|uniref:DUF4240 domain-containing protein n=1 Tax=Saccharopolyspora cebuensis TaxID=418759 RepID=A0ABV4CG31_9PSEU
MSEINDLIDEILEEGFDDWVMLVSIVRSAEERRPDDPQGARTLATALIHELIVGEWMLPGEVEDSGFKPWQEPPADAAARVIRDLDAVDWNVVDNVVAWFDNTDRGNQRADEL